MQLRDWAEVSSLLDRALDLPPADREAFVRASTSDAETAESVLRLVRAAMRETGFMATGPDAPSPASLAPGTRLGAWRVREWLGAGGMGEVYRVARADGQYEQDAALKLMASRDRDVWERFNRERQLLANLDHPNIARLIDGGVVDDGRPYMVMELIEGQPLCAPGETAGLSLRSRLGLFGKVCEAVSHAHSRLVLHRDIKPANILVKHGEPRLLDFGVAGLIAESESDLHAPMTLAYAAPEQIARQPVSVAIDVFGLGATLCEYLTGQPPLRDGTAIRLPPNSLDADLRAILNRAVAADPSARYESAEALGDDVANYLLRRPVQARAGGPLYHARKFLSRYRSVSVATLALVLALAAGLTGTALMAQRAQARADALEAALEDSLRNESVYSAYADAMQRVFGKEEEGTPSVDPSILRGSLLDTAQRANAQLGESGRAPFTLFAIGRTFLFRNDYDAAITVLEPYVQSGEGDPVVLDWSRALLARAYIETGREGEAAPLLRESLAFVEASDKAGTAGHAASASMLALATLERADIDHAISIIDRAIAAETAEFGADDLANRPYLHAQKGNLLVKARQYEAAIAEMERALELERARPLSEVTNTDTILNKLAGLYLYTRNDAARAGPLIAQALERAGEKGESATLGHTLVLQAMLALGDGRAGEAAETLREGGALLDAYISPGAPETRASRALLALVRAEAGDPAMARRTLSALSGPDQNRATPWLARTAIAHAEGDDAAARTALAKASAILESQPAPPLRETWLEAWLRRRIAGD